MIPPKVAMMSAEPPATPVATPAPVPLAVMLATEGFDEDQVAEGVTSLE